MEANCRAIENLLYHYAECIDDGDLEAVAKLFRKGRIFSGAITDAVEGEAAVLAMYQAATRIYPDTGTPHTQHVVSNPIIEIDADGVRASSRSRFTVFQAVPGLPLQPIITGRYRDRFEKTDGQWHFSEREMIPEMLGDLSHHLLFPGSDLQI